MDRNVAHRNGLAQRRLQPLTDPVMLDDLLARLAERTSESWLIRADDHSARRADEDSLLEFLVATESRLYKSAEQANPLLLWVDDVEAPEQILLDSRTAGPAKQADNATDYLLLEDLVASRPRKSWKLFPWMHREPHADIHIDTILEAARQRPQQPLLSSDAVCPESQPANAPVETVVDTADYPQAFRQCRTAVRSLDQLDRLWAHLHGTVSQGWYVNRLGTEPADEVMESKAMHRFLLDIDSAIRMHEEARSAVFVMVDQLQDANFIKIFQPDPVSNEDARPLWTLSRVRPVVMD